MEQEKVYGVGHFASLQPLLNLPQPSHEEPPVIPVIAPPITKITSLLAKKAGYNMPLLLLPAPETSHYSGMSYKPPMPMVPGPPCLQAAEDALVVPKHDDPPMSAPLTALLPQHSLPLLHVSHLSPTAEATASANA